MYVMWLVSVLLPNSLYSPVEMPASRDRVIRSPKLAAIGVATLSGLMPTFLDAIITPIMTRPVECRVRDVTTWKQLRALSLSLCNCCCWANGAPVLFLFLYKGLGHITKGPQGFLPVVPNGQFNSAVCTVWRKKYQNQYSRTKNIIIFIPHILFSCQNLHFPQWNLNNVSGVGNSGVLCYSQLM